MLFGYSKPIIVLPHRRYHEEEAEMILRHEIQHYKNRDLWYKFLIMFVCDLYWFNPVLRLMTGPRCAGLNGECGGKKRAGYWTKHGWNIVWSMRNIQIL